jgi:hypothetical protein
MESEDSLPCSQSPPLETILAQINPVHPATIFFKTHFINIILSTPKSPNGLVPSGFPTNPN